MGWSHSLSTLARPPLIATDKLSALLSPHTQALSPFEWPPLPMRSDARSNISIGGWKGDLSFMKGGRKRRVGGGAHVAFTISTRAGGLHPTTTLILKERGRSGKKLLGRLKWLNLGDHDNGKSWRRREQRVAWRHKEGGRQAARRTTSGKDDNISRETKLSDDNER